MGTNVARYLKAVNELLQKAGPYLLIEIILPGGTLIALLLFLYRRGDLSAVKTVLARARILLHAVAGQLRLVILMLLPDEIAAVGGRDRDGEPDGLEPLAMGPSRFVKV